jgi:hypothetical protein
LCIDDGIDLYGTVDLDHGESTRCHPPRLAPP